MQLMEVLRGLPLKIIELPGRGRKKTGPRESWSCKKLRHSPCRPKKKTAVPLKPHEEKPAQSLVPTKERKVKKCQKTFSETPVSCSKERFSKVQEERATLRAEFEAFADSLACQTKEHVRPTSLATALAVSTSAHLDPTSRVTTGTTQAVHTRKATATDKRFCRRHARRGLAAGSTRPVCIQSRSEMNTLEAMNLGRSSEPLSFQEEREFGVRVVDTSGKRMRQSGIYSAGADRTLRLVSTSPATPVWNAPDPCSNDKNMKCLHLTVKCGGQDPLPFQVLSLIHI